MKLLKGYDSWLNEPPIRRQVSGALGELAKEVLQRSAESLASLPAHHSVSLASSPKELRWSCIIFMAYKLNGGDREEGKHLQIDKLAEYCSFPLTEFLKELLSVTPKVLPHFAEVLGESEETLDRRLQIRELQMSYIFMSTLLKRYLDLFTSKFELSTPSHPYSDPNFRLGWLVFLLGKTELLPVHCDLVSSFHLLVCVLNTLLAHMPKRRLRFKFADKLIMPKQTEDGRVDTVASLAVICRAIPSEVEPLVKKLDALLQPVLEEAGLSPSKFPFSEQLEISCRYFPGLLDDSSARKEVLMALEDAYCQANLKKGGLYDEQVFLEPDRINGNTSPLRMTPRVSQWHMLKSSPFHNSDHSMPSPLRQPVANAVPTSPLAYEAGRLSIDGSAGMSETLSSSTWLRQLASTTLAEPSEDLKRYMRSCDTDKTEEVVSRVKELAQVVFPCPVKAEGQEASGSGGGTEGTESMDPETLLQRREEAVKVYYRVLEAVLLGEERRTGSCNMTTLLSSNSFHCCLLACSFEVVVACYRMITMPFPAILERLGLKAFDIFKIIQCFVKHEPTLPREVKRHLISIEEQVVESLAWAEGSSLYPTLIAAKAQLDATSKRRSQQLNRPQRKRTLFAAENDSNVSDSPLVDTATPSGLAKLKTRVSSILHTSSARPPVSPRKTNLAGSSPSRHGMRCSQPVSPIGSTPNSAFHVVASPAPKRLRTGPGGGDSAAPASPAPLQRSSLPSAISSAIEVPSGGDSPVVLLMRDFFKKATIIAAMRLAQLCESLDFAPFDHRDVLGKVYSVVKLAIMDRTHMLYGRHLDQLLLCALYGTCKVLRLERMTFKEVMEHYKRQSGPGTSARKDVLHHVVLSFGENSLIPSEEGDIISYYNKVFIRDMKDVLMNVGSGSPKVQGPSTPEGQRVPGLHQLRTAPVASSPLRNCSGGGAADFPFPTSPSKMKVSSEHKVFLSPMRDPVMTPRTKTLFCMGGIGDQPGDHNRQSTPKSEVNIRSAPSFAMWNMRAQADLAHAIASANRMDTSELAPPPELPRSLSHAKPHHNGMAE